MPQAGSPKARNFRAWITALYGLVIFLFALSVLIQIGFAGDAALLDPDGWRLHTKWVAIFQWLSIALAILAFFVRRDWLFRVLNCIPILILFLQYATIHYAIQHAEGWVVGLHAVGGAILFGFLIFLFTEWRHPGASG